MIEASILELGAALSRLSDAEFLAALGMSLVGLSALTWIGLLYRAPGCARAAGTGQRRTVRAA